MKWILSALAAIVAASLVAHAATIGVPPQANGDFSTINQRWLMGLAGGQNQNFTSGITAHSGGGQQGATRLPVNYALISVDVVAGPGDSLMLPKCDPPFNFQVINNGANAATFYVRLNTNDTINGQPSNTAFTLSAGNTAFFVCAKATQWTANQVSATTGGGGGGSTIVAGSTPTSGIASGNLIGSTANLVVDSGVPYASVAIQNAPVTFTAGVFTTLQATAIGGITPGTGLFTGLNATSIGATTPGSGAFTGLNATSIGASSPGSGLFTTLSATSFNSGSIGATTPGSVVTTTFQSTGSIRAPVRNAVSVSDALSATTDYMVCPLNSAAPATENLPAAPPTGLTFLIKDCGGTAAAHSITLTPASGTIDGAASFVMSVNYSSIAVTYTGAQWSLN